MTITSAISLPPNEEHTRSSNAHVHQQQMGEESLSTQTPDLLTSSSHSSRQVFQIISEWTNP
jgi:hypothetical protein